MHGPTLMNREESVDGIAALLFGLIVITSVMSTSSLRIECGFNELYIVT